MRCNVHMRVKALTSMPLHGVNNVDVPLQERRNSRKKLNRVYLRDRNPPKMGILLSRATIDIIYHLQINPIVATYRKGSI